MEEHYYVSIDIGSSSIKTIVLEWINITLVPEIIEYNPINIKEKPKNNRMCLNALSKSFILMNLIWALYRTRTDNILLTREALYH